jgi:lysophospholipid acyltransferase (LPLAT)-like uncharacterized protein
MGQFRYRVDNLPLYLRPLVKAYGISAAAVMTLVLQTLRITCHWEYVNGERYAQPCLHVAWHESVPAYMCSYMMDPAMPQRHYWLQHAAAYMSPIHTLIHWHGIQYILGSSGHDGQAALETLKNEVTANHGSSAFFVDGPSGPIRHVKPGVVQLAQATGLPMIPIRYEFSDSWRFGWDQKHFPKPGSKVMIHELEPIFVDPRADRKQILDTLQKLLE